MLQQMGFQCHKNHVFNDAKKEYFNVVKNECLNVAKIKHFNAAQKIICTVS